MFCDGSDVCGMCSLFCDGVYISFAVWLTCRKSFCIYVYVCLRQHARHSVWLYGIVAVVLTLSRIVGTLIHNSTKSMHAWLQRALPSTTTSNEYFCAKAHSIKSSALYRNVVRS